jgi:formylglycine-generating enzyme required for sulfatase activity
VAIETVGQWPANVSLAEAEAYCRWRGKRLPTEAEMHRAAYAAPDGTQRLYPWGDQAPQKQHGNFGWQYFSPVPVGSHPAGASAWGVEELVGNGWEWTTTLFRGLPGFKPYARTYPGYSQDFFDDLHCVIFGGAWPTDSVFLRRSYRNWFQRRYPYVFAAFRCVST